MFGLFGSVQSQGIIPWSAEEAIDLARQFCHQHGFPFDRGLAPHEVCHVICGRGVSPRDEGFVTGFGCEMINQYTSWDASINRLTREGISRREATALMEEGAAYASHLRARYPHLPELLRSIG